MQNLIKPVLMLILLSLISMTAFAGDETSGGTPIGTEAEATKEEGDNATAEKPEEIKDEAAKEEKAYTPSPLVQNYILDRLSLGFQFGQSFVSHDKIENAHGFVAILFHYKIGDMINSKSALLKGLFAGFEYDAISAMAYDDQHFYRTTSYTYLLNAGLQSRLSSFMAGSVWQENVIISVLAGLGVVMHNTLDEFEVHPNRYQSKIPGGFIMSMKGIVGYQVYGPWRVNFNVGFEVGATQFVLAGLGLHSSF